LTLRSDQSAHKSIRSQEEITRKSVSERKRQERARGVNVAGIKLDSSLEAHPADEQRVQPTEGERCRDACLEIAPGDKEDEKAECDLRLDRQESCDSARLPRFVVEHEHDHRKGSEKHERVHLPRVQSKEHWCERQRDESKCLHGHCDAPGVPPNESMRQHDSATECSAAQCRPYDQRVDQGQTRQHLEQRGHVRWMREGTRPFERCWRDERALQRQLLVEIVERCRRTMEQRACAVKDDEVVEEHLSAQTSPAGGSGEIDHHHGPENDQDDSRIDLDATWSETKRHRV
jgi:hypothetical protein